MRCLVTVLVLLMAAGVSVAGTPGEAAAITAEYNKAMSQWMEGLRTADSQEQQRALAAKRPDAADYGRRMRRCIGSQLDEPWTLKPAAWLLRMSVALRQVGAAPAANAPPNEWVQTIGAIRKALEKDHLASSDPGLVTMCVALVDLPDPGSLGVLEKIESGHPDKKLQGVAALSISMVLRNLGDEGDVMARRLKMLRKAIIESSEVEIDEGMTVAKAAEDELYVIRWLSKGRRAPDIGGKDVAGRPIKLSDHGGKVLVLLFWGSWNEDASRMMEMAREWKTKLAGKPFEVVGVNADPVKRLRELVAAGDVTWPNFSDPERVLAAEYRVNAWPIAFVLDRKREIRFIGAPGSFVELTVEEILREAG